MNDIVKNVSTLSTINERYLKKLVDIERMCITDAVLDDLEEGDISEVDIGIGKLYTKVENDSIKMKFIPDETLCNYLSEAMKNGKSNLEVTLDRNLIDKVSNVYKELI